jgi:hypothetical protein
MAAKSLEKKEKKDKKRSDESGVSKSKKDKKDKKDKKEKLAAALEDKLQQDAAAQASDNSDTKIADAEEVDSDEETTPSELPLERTVVPFAIPVADEKGQKKVYKAIRKGTASIPYCDISFQKEAVLIMRVQFTDLSLSGQEQQSKARRQGSRQDPPQVAALGARLHILPRRGRHRGRHLPAGRHLAPPRALRGPQRALHLRHLARRARRRRQDEAPDQRRHDHREGRRPEEGQGRRGRQEGRRGRGELRGDVRVAGQVCAEGDVEAGVLDQGVVKEETRTWKMRVDRQYGWDLLVSGVF